MTSNELRKKFLSFFVKKKHKIVPSSSLIPTDTSVLFTTAGMQQFKNYFLGEKSPHGNKVTSCQKCFRTSDIDEVGDKSHLTFLEMLGNFSFGDYFKEEAIKLAYKLLISNFQIPISKLWITYFKGDAIVPEDKKSKEVWRKIKIPENRIFGFSKKDNFWGPTGIEGPCGPTTEIHLDLTGKPCQKGKNCIPNCECGRFIELWNLVFNEYYQDKNQNLTLLKQKGVDTGMGLERLAVVCQLKNSVYETDLFEPIIKEIEKNTSKSYNLHLKAYRVIADHIKSSVFLISEGIFPSNVERGYILRRIIRRAIRYKKLLDLPKNFLITLSQKVIEIYKNIYPELLSNQADILTVVQKEEEKFEKTIEKGLIQFDKLLKSKTKEEKIIKGEEVFNLYQSYGFPLELTEELAREKSLEIDKIGFDKAFEKHQEISRAGVQKKFGGLGKEATYESIKLHTATHLLHAALRQILGSHVKQMGSDINPQRLRFDFSHSQKLTKDELKRTEDLVNKKIKEDLEIKKREMNLKDALKSGALSFFKEKYPEIVTVYSIGDFSKEICAGPHVKKTSELGYFRITKEESSGAGVRRIKAVLE